MKISYSIDELKSLINPASVEGATNASITGIGSIENAQPGELAFLANPKYKSHVPSSKASLLLVPTDYEGQPNLDQVFFKVDNPAQVLSLLCSALEQHLWPKAAPGIHPSAVIDEAAQVDPSASIGPLCVISKGAKIGKEVVLGSGVYVGVDCTIGESSHLMPQVRVLDYCTIGSRVRIHSGVVIGSDGFGYTFDSGVHNKIPQVGSVVIEDDVEIGANTVIDRARFSETRIGQGTKIDNLVQIAHNVTIGKHCLVVSQAGIAGSSSLEDYVVVGGQVGIADHINVGQGAKIGSQSGLNCDIAPGAHVRGSPHCSYMLAQRTEILKRRLPEFVKRISKLEETIESLQIST